MRALFLLGIGFMVAVGCGCSPDRKAAQDSPATGAATHESGQAAPSAETTPQGGVAANVEATAPGTKCEHGVDKTLCTRCDPRLEAVFQAKGDWCAEHARPESQCALCHPDLAAQGVK